MWLCYALFWCASLACVSVNELLFSVYFICILGYGNDVRQKAHSNDFLIGVEHGS